MRHFPTKTAVALACAVALGAALFVGPSKETFDIKTASDKLRCRVVAIPDSPGYYLTTTECTWEELRGLRVTEAWLPRWRGTLFACPVSPKDFHAFSPLEDFPDNACVRSGVYFFGDAEMIRTVRREFRR